MHFLYEVRVHLSAAQQEGQQDDGVRGICKAEKSLFRAQEQRIIFVKFSFKIGKPCRIEVSASMVFLLFGHIRSVEES